MGSWVRILAIAAAAIVLPSVYVSYGESAKRQLSQAADHPPEAAEPPAGPAREGTPATVMDNQEIEGILGKSVRSNADEDMGRIVDILVNRTGQVKGAVIDFGGFLGVGSRKVAVDWAALHFPDSRKSGRITLDLTRDQVRLAPEYRRGEPIVILHAPEAQPTTTAVSPGPDK